MPDFEIRSDLHVAERELDYLARFLVDLRSFWPLVTTRVIGWISEQFESEGRAWTGGWEPLFEPYRTWKADHFPGKGILSMYGDLRRAATTPTRIATPQSLTLEINGFTHRETGREIDPSWFQEGTANMPPRPLIGEVLTPRMEAELHAAADEYVDSLVASLGRH